MDDICQKITQIHSNNKQSQNSVIGKLVDSCPSQSGIETLKVLATNPVKAHVIARDAGIMGGLILVLDNPDKCLVKSSLECLSKLAELSSNREIMVNTLGMMESLQTVITSSNESLKVVAQSVYAQLSACLKPKPEPQSRPLRDTLNVIPEDICKKQSKSKTRRRSFFVGVNNSKSKTVVLFIRGWNNKDELEVCRNQLLTVKGVISITFDFKQRRSIIRAKPDLKTELLAKAISKTQTMVAEQVIKEDDGTESYVPFNDSDLDDKENGDMLDYPPDDSPIKGENLLARPGDAKAEGWGFLTTAANFLQNSFYW